VKALSGGSPGLSWKPPRAKCSNKSWLFARTTSSLMPDRLTGSLIAFGLGNPSPMMTVMVVVVVVVLLLLLVVPSAATRRPKGRPLPPPAARGRRRVLR